MIIHPPQPLRAAPPSADLEWICSGCEQPIRPGTGALFITDEDMDRRSNFQTMMLAKTTHLMNIDEARLDFDTIVPWHAMHYGCQDPNTSVFYEVDVGEVQHDPGLLEVSGRLLRKPWLADTDWNKVLNAAAGRTPGIVRRKA